PEVVGRYCSNRFVPVYPRRIAFRQSQSPFSGDLECTVCLFVGSCSSVRFLIMVRNGWRLSETNIGLHQKPIADISQLCGAVEQSSHHLFERRFPSTDTFDPLSLTHVGPPRNADGRVRHLEQSLLISAHLSRNFSQPKFKTEPEAGVSDRSFSLKRRGRSVE